MPLLMWTAFAHHARAFAWLLLACLLSDIADGVIARRLHLESAVGAALDSLADALLMVVAVIGMIVLQPAFAAAHAIALIFFAVLYVMEVMLSFARYGRLSSFHTYLTRVSAYAQGIFFVSLFFWGDVPWLFDTAWTLGCAGLLEELALLAVVPTWTPDVRGLYWVLKARGA